MKTAKSVREAVYGDLQACRHECAAQSKGKCRRAQERPPLDFGSLRKRGVRMLMNCTGRSAVRCT